MAVLDTTLSTLPSRAVNSKTQAGWADDAKKHVYYDYIHGEAERLSYLSVPLFLGGNIYAFDRFPLRPYAGMGFGLDVLRVDYDRHVPDMIVDPGIDPTLSDVSARIGFELHAGLELRIRNVVTLSAEVMQLWSKRRNLNGVPDFSNEGFTVILGLSYAFELVDGSPGQTKTVVRKRKAAPAPR